MSLFALLLTATMTVAPHGATIPSRASVERMRPDTVTDTTFFITNRVRRAGQFQRERSDSLSFGLLIVRFVETPSTSLVDQLLRPLKSQIVDSVFVSRAEFVAALHDADARSAATGDGPVLYVHGYGNSFRRGITQASEIMRRGRADGPVIAFAWPASRMLLSWPRRDALISGTYRQDSAMAVASQGAFREAIGVVLEATRPGSLTLLGHSMGAQLLSEAFRTASPVRDQLRAEPARAIVLFAPDISAARFRDSLAAPVATLAHRRVVYVSNNDRILAISRMVNHTPRAGQATAARALAVDDLEIVDVTAGLRGDSFWRGLLDPGHGMKFAGSALYDFFGVIRGMPSECRAAAGVATQTGERSWRLARVPIPPAQGACTRAASGA